MAPIITTGHRARVESSGISRYEPARRMIAWGRGRGMRIASVLSVRNYRLFFLGQMVSVSGTWMQRVAQAWLVLDLTGSGTAVGVVTALQAVPALVLGPVGGWMADRFDKRRILILTQLAASVMALGLGWLVVADLAELWIIYVFAFGLGITGSVDVPTRQAFVMEMVGRDKLTNAVGLNSVLVNVARMIGPAVAGVLIVAAGIGFCFLINGLSYLALVVALLMMRTRDFFVSGSSDIRGAPIRSALARARATPGLVTLLLMVAVISIFSYQFEVILPLLARFTFGGDALILGTMFVGMGAGAMLGGLVTASRTRMPDDSLSTSAFLLGAGMACMAAAPYLWVAFIGLVIVGAAGTSFLALASSALQLKSPVSTRGFVVGLWSVAFLGMRPVGALLIGYLGENRGARFGVAVGAVAAAAVGGWAYRVYGAPRSQVNHA